jgi:hypothetical protein
VTNRRVKEITERIKNAGKYYKLARDVIQKWKMSRTGPFSCMEKNMSMDKHRY